MSPSVRAVLVLVLTFAGASVVMSRSSGSALQAPASPDERRLSSLKAAAIDGVDQRADLVQQIVDSVFSFGELGYQEVETSRYLTTVLEHEGFTVEHGVGGMPTAWVARWGSGKPVIALGSDIDGIPRASQRPGVAYRDPLVEGAPGHGEGHNSGQAVNIAAAIAVKELMEREQLPGTLVLWPGVAEELVGGKAYLVRAGVFEDVDVCLFSHVSSGLGVTWGEAAGSGLVSVEYTFDGQSAHSAVAPWRGRSALDAVELMNIGWNFRREHLRLQHRSHYVITDGGDQPNVVPSTASVWYYFRELDYDRIRQLWETGDQIAEGAAMMTGTKLARTRVLGSAWPRHFNKAVAEAMDANIQAVGMPEWSEADVTLARAVQEALNMPPAGLTLAVEPLGPPVSPDVNQGGGSDDIGDVSWVVPTVTLRYPANIQMLPGHSWWNSIAMATPIAHKGSLVGARVMAATMIDLLLQPALVDEAWTYFREVQTRDQSYVPFIREQDEPAIELNRNVMGQYREAMRPFYYDPTRHRTYLEQLGVAYPVVSRD
jgi:aminobenzoyl-glutamate utilization protein B